MNRLAVKYVLFRGEEELAGTEPELCMYSSLEIPEMRGLVHQHFFEKRR
jgi:hypothetical protein